jgi:DNA-binding FadR family transcriptional regulator
VTLRSLRPSPLVEQATGQLRAQIADGAWPVGTRIPGETTLAEALGVGRSTIREAIRALAGEGLVRPRQGSGVYVIATEARGDLATRLREAAVNDVYEVRLMVEVHAARLAAERRTEADIAALDAALATRTKAAGASDEAFVDADIALHRAVVAAADNPVLTELFDQFVPTLREGIIEICRLIDRAGENIGHAAHAGLVEAVRDGDPDRAAGVLAEEITHTLGLLRAHADAATE